MSMHVLLAHVPLTRLHTSTAPHRGDEIKAIAKSIECHTCSAALELAWEQFREFKGMFGEWSQRQKTWEETIATTFDMMCISDLKGHMASIYNPFPMHYLLFAENVTTPEEEAVLGKRRAALLRKPGKFVIGDAKDAFKAPQDVEGSAVRLACLNVVGEHIVELTENVYKYVKGKVNARNGKMPPLRQWEFDFIPQVCQDELSLCTSSELKRLRQYTKHATTLRPAKFERQVTKERLKAADDRWEKKDRQWDLLEWREIDGPLSFLRCAQLGRKQCL